MHEQQDLLSGLVLLLDPAFSHHYPLCYSHSIMLCKGACLCAVPTARLTIGLQVYDLLVEQSHSGEIKAISWSQLAVFGPASIHCCPNLGSQYLAQLHTPLVKAVNTPHKTLQKHMITLF